MSKTPPPAQAVTLPADPVRRWMLEQIINVLWFQADLTKDEKRAHALAAIAAFDALCQRYRIHGYFHPTSRCPAPAAAPKIAKPAPR